MPTTGDLLPLGGLSGCLGTRGSATFLLLCPPCRLINYPWGLVALGFSWLSPCPGFFLNALSHSDSPLHYKKASTLVQTALKYNSLCFNSAKKNLPNSPLRFWDFPTWICQQWRAVLFKRKTQRVSLINSRMAFGDSDALYLFIYLLYMYLFYTNAFNSPYLYHITQHGNILWVLP